MKKFSLFFFALFCIQATALKAQDYVLIVNASNPMSSISKSEVSKIFLKKSSTFNDGSSAVPVDLAEGAVRDSFSKAVLNRSVSAIKNYWSQQMFSGAGVPPEEKGSDREIAAFVASEAGGIGYVSAGFDVSAVAGVKAISIE